jgi:peptidoglycan/xylan/chitin deacetylase (PgdA/CDA1 family)
VSHRWLRVCASAFALLIVLGLPVSAIAAPIVGDSIARSSVVTLALPATCAAHETTQAVATLCDDLGVPLAGEPVRIEQVYPSRSVIASGLTDAGGHLRATVSPRSRIALIAIFDGDATYLPAMSPTASISPRVELSQPWTHDSFAYPGQWLPARGTLLPKHSAASTSTTVVCQRLEHGAWVTHSRFKAAITNTKAASHFSAKVRFSSIGSWRVVAEHQDDAHALSKSRPTAVKVTSWRDRYKGRKVGGFRTKQKLVAITIDDGPNKRTLKICSILEKYGARGTFFFTRKLLVRGYGPQAKKAYDRGHEIENHTISHAKLIRSYAFDRREALGTMQYLQKAIGFPSTWVRAMGGEIDATGMRAVASTNQLYCNWSIDSNDSHQRYMAPSKVYSNVVAHVRPGDVILIHQTHPESVAALPRICRELRRRGFKMVTLSRLASVSKPR